MKILISMVFFALTVGCATSAPPNGTKSTTAYVSIDEVYPVFALQKAGNPANVKIPATKDQVARWKAAAAAYAQAQKEIEEAVNHYEPLAIKNKKGTK